MCTYTHLYMYVCMYVCMNYVNLEPETYVKMLVIFVMSFLETEF